VTALDLSSSCSRPLRAAVAAACAAVLLLAHLGAAPARADVVDTDPAVVQARARFAAEQERAAALTRELDAAAGAFEHADAHRLRLLGEVAAREGAVDRAEEQLREAEAAFADRVAESYMSPGAAHSLMGAVAAAPDAATALHRASLLQRLTVSERLRAARAASVRTRTGGEARQHEVVRLGVSGAVDDAARRAAALDDLLTSARREAAAAGDAVSDAERAVRVRIEEEERAAAARAAAARAELAAQAADAARAAQAAQAAQAVQAVQAVQAAEAARAARSGTPGDTPADDGAVVRPVGGGPVGSGPRACPIGSPNGFIDSWGFPRSGGRSHQGVDIFAVHGMPLHAVADGVIRRVYNNRLGGLSIDLIDDVGDRYYYAHLSSAAVTDGQRVRAGEVIGANGNSGNARTTPPHLHWQYHPGGGAAVNPYPLAVALCR
jgi:peptidoglycan LD-endopeptidase LytH